MAAKFQPRFSTEIEIQILQAINKLRIENRFPVKISINQELLKELAISEFYTNIGKTHMYKQIPIAISKLASPGNFFCGLSCLLPGLFYIKAKVNFLVV